MYGVNKKDNRKLFYLSPVSKIKDHLMKLKPGRIRADKNKCTLMHCVWNYLPQEVVMTTSLAGLKKRVRPVHGNHEPQQL